MAGYAPNGAAWWVFPLSGKNVEISATRQTAAGHNRGERSDNAIPFAGDSPARPGRRQSQCLVTRLGVGKKGERSVFNYAAGPGEVREWTH